MRRWVVVAGCSGRHNEASVVAVLKRGEKLRKKLSKGGSETVDQSCISDTPMCIALHR